MYKRVIISTSAEISVIVCDGNKLDVLLEKVHECPKLKHIIKIGDVSEEDVQNAGKFGIAIKSFKDVEVNNCRVSIARHSSDDFTIAPQASSRAILVRATDLKTRTG